MNQFRLKVSGRLVLVHVWLMFPIDHYFPDLSFVYIFGQSDNFSSLPAERRSDNRFFVNRHAHTHVQNTRSERIYFGNEINRNYRMTSPACTQDRYSTSAMRSQVTWDGTWVELIKLRNGNYKPVKGFVLFFTVLIIRVLFKIYLDRRQHRPFAQFEVMFIASWTFVSNH